MKILDIIFQLLSNPEPLWKSGSILYSQFKLTFICLRIVYIVIHSSMCIIYVCMFIPKKVMSVSRSHRSITLYDDLETLLARYHAHDQISFSSLTDFGSYLKPWYLIILWLYYIFSSFLYIDNNDFRVFEHMINIFAARCDKIYIILTSENK